MAKNPNIIGVEDVAAMFGVDKKTISRWAKAGRFPEGTIFVTLGGQRRYYRDKVEALMAQLGYRDGPLVRG